MNKKCLIEEGIALADCIETESCKSNGLMVISLLMSRVHSLTLLFAAAETIITQDDEKSFEQILNSAEAKKGFKTLKDHSIVEVIKDLSDYIGKMYFSYERECKKFVTEHLKIVHERSSSESENETIQ